MVIGFAVGDGEPEAVHRAPGGSEAGLLLEFWRQVSALALDRHHGHAAGVEWVGHNVGFDLRFLRQRCAVHRIAPALRLEPNARHGMGHLFCTMQEWAGPRDFIGLDALTKALGLESPKADGFDGSQVYDAWTAGRAGEIAAYCKRDVAAAREVYRVLSFQSREAA